MHALVDSQGRPLNELFAASWIIANVGSDSTMDPFMASQVAPPGKPFAAGAAGVCLRRCLGRILLLKARLRHRVLDGLREVAQAVCRAHVGVRDGGERAAHGGWRRVGRVHGARVSRVLGAVWGVRAIHDQLRMELRLTAVLVRHDALSGPWARNTRAGVVALIVRPEIPKRKKVPGRENDGFPICAEHPDGVKTRNEPFYIGRNRRSKNPNEPIHSSQQGKTAHCPARFGAESRCRLGEPSTVSAA